MRGKACLHLAFFVVLGALGSCVEPEDRVSARRSAARASDGGESSFSSRRSQNEVLLDLDNESGIVSSRDHRLVVTLPEQSPGSQLEASVRSLEGSSHWTAKQGHAEGAFELVGPMYEVRLGGEVPRERPLLVSMSLEPFSASPFSERLSLPVPEGLQLLVFEGEAWRALPMGQNDERGPKRIAAEFSPTSPGPWVVAFARHVEVSQACTVFGEQVAQSLAAHDLSERRADDDECEILGSQDVTFMVAHACEHNAFDFDVAEPDRAHVLVDCVLERCAQDSLMDALLGCQEAR